MKKLLAIIMSLVMLTFAVSCDFNWLSVELSENQIVLIYRYENHASDHQDLGYFITGNGNMYKFDFSNRRSDGFASDLEEFQEIIRTEKPKHTVGANKAKRIYYYATQIDENAKFESEDSSCDAGRATLSVYNGKGFITISKYVDVVGELDDESAREIIGLFEKGIRDRYRLRFNSVAD